MRDLIRAKELLATDKYTCVLCRDGENIFSEQRGVKPLVDMYSQGVDLKGFSAADKVVGKATAFLYLLLGVNEIYARVISRLALELLSENGVFVEYGVLTENIINRRGDGICPFEEAVLGISDRQEAYRVIICKMKEMGI